MKTNISFSYEELVIIRKALGLAVKERLLNEETVIELMNLYIDR